MKTELMRCGSCNGDEPHAHIGFVPSLFINDEPGWSRAIMCLECGALSVSQVTEEEYQTSVERYIDLLSDNNIMERDEAEKYIYGE